FLAMAAQTQVDAGWSKLEVAQYDLVQKRRQARIAQTDLAARGIEFEAERCLQHGESRTARPRLRRAGNRIEHRAAPPLAPETAEQFRQPPQIHVARSVEQALEQMRHRMLQAVTAKAQRDHRIVVRPDRS